MKEVLRFVLMWSGLEHSLCKASILFMAIIKINTKESWLIKRKESRRDLQREVQLPWGQEQVPALVQKGLWCLFQDDCVFLFFCLFVCFCFFILQFQQTQVSGTITPYFPQVACMSIATKTVSIKRFLNTYVVDPAK